MTRSPVLFADVHTSLDHSAGHVLVAGNSGTGKTGCLSLIARAKIRNPLTGLHLVDPDGELSPACYEYIANPQQGLGWRTVHYLRPASPNEAFALPLLHVPDRAPEPCHNKAVRALTIFEQAINFGAGDYGPRLSKFFYMGCLGLALSGRPLVDLPDLFGRGARHLRELIGSAFPFPFLTDEWQSIDLLNDRAFLEYRDPLVSRLMPIFGNGSLRRVFGPQRPLDIAAILRNREVVLLDLSGLEHKDAVLIGKAYLSILYHEALQRAPNREPYACVMLDEAFDFVTVDLARGFDRLRKRNIQLCIAIQRFSQLKKATDDDAVAILSAAVTNTRTKILFGGLEPDDADFMTRVMFTGFVDLAQWKDGSERPVAVGQHKEIVHNRSTAHHQAVHETTATTRSVAVGHARSHMRATSHGVSEGIAEATSDTLALGSMSGEAFGSAAASFDGTSNSTTMDPTTGILTPPAITSLGAGATSGSGMTDTASRSSANSSTHISGSSSARMSATIDAETEAFGETESIVEGSAVTHGRGESRGTSQTTGESETFVTTYVWMPTQLFALPEQLHRLAGEVINLGLRECFVKIGNQRPVRTRTLDLEPTFKSDYFRRIMLPLFHKKAVAQSPYLFRVTEVDAAIAARFNDGLTPKPLSEPDFTAPEPLPVVDTPTSFAKAFWDKRKKPSAPRPKGKPDLRLVDGDKPEDDT